MRPQPFFGKWKGRAEAGQGSMPVGMRDLDNRQFLDSTEIVGVASVNGQVIGKGGGCYQSVIGSCGWLPA